MIITTSFYNLKPYNRFNRISSWGFNKGCLQSEYTSVLLSDDWKEYKDHSCLSQIGDPNDTSSLAWLMTSIYKYGVIHTLKGFEENGVFVVTDGLRRLLACRLLWLRETNFDIEVPFQVEQKTTEIEYLRRRLIGDRSAVKLSAYEQGYLLRELMILREASHPNDLFGKFHDMKGTGLSLATVKQRLRLMDLPFDIQYRLITGEITQTAAIKLMKNLKQEI